MKPGIHTSNFSAVELFSETRDVSLHSLQSFCVSKLCCSQPCVFLDALQHFTTLDVMWEIEAALWLHKTKKPFATHSIAYIDNPKLKDQCRIVSLRSCFKNTTCPEIFQNSYSTFQPSVPETLASREIRILSQAPVSMSGVPKTRHCRRH